MAQPGSIQSLRGHWGTDHTELPEPAPLIEMHAPGHQPPPSYSRSGHGDGGNKANNASAPADEETDSNDCRTMASKCQKKRFVLPLAFVILVLAVGSVLAGVLGTIVRTSGGSEGGSSTITNTTSSDAIGLGASSSIHPSSHLAAAIAGSHSSNTRVVIFQNPDKDLVVIEWQGSSGDAQLVGDMSGEDNHPKPLAQTPLQVVEFGLDGDLHLFYIDDGMHLAHVVRRTGSGKDGDWEIGSLSTSEGQSKLPSQPADTLRLSVTVLAAETDSSATDAEYLVIMYQIDPGSDYVLLVSSSTPDDASSWESHGFSLGTGKFDLNMNPKSSGLLILPAARDDSDSTVPCLRLLWDLADDSHKTGFGAFECTFTEKRTLKNCLRIYNDWKDPSTEDPALESVKPLQFSALALTDRSRNPSAIEYIVRLLGHSGNMIELHGNQKGRTGHQNFVVGPASMPKELSVKFTAIASADDGILYALSDGRLLEFVRRGTWWTEDGGGDAPGWEFLSVIDTTVTKG